MSVFSNCVSSFGTCSTFSSRVSWTPSRLTFSCAVFLRRSDPTRQATLSPMRKKKPLRVRAPVVYRQSINCGCGFSSRFAWFLRHSPLRPSQTQVLDIIGPANPARITWTDLCRCRVGHTVVRWVFACCSCRMSTADQLFLCKMHCSILVDYVAYRAYESSGGRLPSPSS